MPKLFLEFILSDCLKGQNEKTDNLKRRNKGNMRFSKKVLELKVFRSKELSAEENK